MPELSNLGNLFKSSSLPTELTESETEYVVRCVKHVFPQHIVFQVSKEYLHTESENEYLMLGVFQVFLKQIVFWVKKCTFESETELVTQSAKHVFLRCSIGYIITSCKTIVTQVNKEFVCHIH